jgi:hypothetical protein
MVTCILKTKRRRTYVFLIVFNKELRYGECVGEFSFSLYNCQILFVCLSSSHSLFQTAGCRKTFNTEGNLLGETIPGKLLALILRA